MISKLLFESPWMVLVLLVVIQFGLTAIWSRRRSRLWARIVWTGLGAIPLLPLVSILVVTSREQIVGLCHDLAAMVDEGDAAAIGLHLAGDFEAAGLDRMEFLERVERTLARYGVDNARLHRFNVAFPRKKEGVAVFDSTCRIRSVDAFLDRLTARWRVTFRSHDGPWQVTKIEALPTPLSPIRSVHDCLH